MSFTPKNHRILGRIFLGVGAVIGLWSLYNMGYTDDSPNIAAPVSSFFIAIGVFFVINSKKQKNRNKSDI